jgi:hypothetical protein
MGVEGNDLILINLENSMDHKGRLILLAYPGGNQI